MIFIPVAVVFGQNRFGFFCVLRQDIRTIVKNRVELFRTEFAVFLVRSAQFAAVALTFEELFVNRIQHRVVRHRIKIRYGDGLAIFTLLHRKLQGILIYGFNPNLFPRSITEVTVEIVGIAIDNIHEQFFCAGVKFCTVTYACNKVFCCYFAIFFALVGHPLDTRTNLKGPYSSVVIRFPGFCNSRL